MKTQLSICFGLIFFLHNFSQTRVRVSLKNKFLKQTNLTFLIASKSNAVPPCTMDTVINSQWDGGTNSWALNDKTIYTYDLHNNPLVEVSWNYTGTWKQSQRILRSFNTADQPVSELWQHFFGNSWKNSSLYTYTYNSNFDVLNRFYQSWNSANNSWSSGNWSINTYSNTDLVETLYKVWISNTNSWRDSEKYLYTYDNSHHLLTEIDQTWNSTANLLENDSKITYAYDIFSNITGMNVQVWNSGASTWLNDQKLTATYNGTNLTSYTVMEWDSTANSWVNSGKYTFTYDASNNLLSQTTQGWDTQTMSWVNIEKENNTYDPNNKLINHRYQEWQTPSNTWQDESIENYAYDTRGNRIYSEFQERDIATHVMVNEQNTKTFYNCTTVGLSEIGGVQNTLIYPNPAANSIRIETNLDYKYIMILNLEGKEMIKVQSVHDIDISQLNPGFYFLQLTDKSSRTLMTQKLIKE
jgi:hypothetical protein